MNTFIKKILLAVIFLLPLTSYSTVIFQDSDFSSGWSNYRNGSVERSNDQSKIGTHSLKKFNNTDPNGGWKSLGSTVERNYTLEGWFYRPTSPRNGAEDRIAISDGNFNGYGLRVTGSNVFIERRTDGNATNISSGTAWNRPNNQWYRFHFAANDDNTFTARIFDLNGTEVVNLTSNANTTHVGPFDRVVIHGGTVYYVDGLKVTDNSNAEELDIAQKPLFLTSRVDPNIMFTLDDSGSMHWEFMPDSSQFRFTLYMFPRPTGLYGAGDYANQVPSFRDDNLHNFFGRSSANNAVFYNPDITYGTWMNADGSLMPDANPTNALYNPSIPSLGGLNLTVRQTQSAVWFRGNNFTQGICDPCNGNHTFWPITYYNYIGGDKTARSSYERVQITNTTPASATFTSPSGITRTRDEEIQNFANWFQYSRSRILASRNGIGQAFSQLSNSARVGYATINASDTIVSGVKPFSGENRQAFYDLLYNRPIPQAGTPLRRAADNVGKYFERTDERGPWSSTPEEAGGTSGTDDFACRLSFNILMTDGFWNGGNPSSTIGNSDNANGPVISSPTGQTYQYTPTDPFRDNLSNTLADVAMHYWKRDLRPDLDNLVPTSPNNPAFWQHLTSFGIGLGVRGNLNPDDVFSAIENETSIDWGDPFNSNPAKIDDLLHFGVNGRGGFFSADDPVSFANQLGALLRDIESRSSPQTTPVSSSSFFPTPSTLLFASSFDSEYWNGNITAFKPSFTAGSLSITQEWDAASQLPSHTSRNIITTDNDGNPTEFKWVNSGKLGLTYTENILDYIRGKSDSSLRNRGSSVIGDIINSNPIYVHRQHFGYHRLGVNVPEAKTYQEFVLDKRNRTPLVVVGANAGKLHGFDANTGVELFAYIPNDFLGSLGTLAAEEYDRRYFVDGTPHVSDAYIDNEWKTILIGSLGAGGKSLFALDITDPDNFTKDNVMWEFKHADLGYTFAEPTIARLKNGTWVVIVGNGYNSNSSTAKLLVIDLKTGALLKSIDTQVGGVEANGLSSAAILRGSENGNTFASQVYAGDLLGNLWKFDLNNTDVSTFSVANSGNPLFVAKSSVNTQQPITVRPSLKLHPQGGIMVMFGTGRYLTTSDASDQSIQSIYGIRDLGAAVDRNTLQQQSISFRGKFPGSSTDITVLSNSSVNYSLKNGWVLDLIYDDKSEGERLVTNPQLLNDRLRIATQISNSNPCLPGASSWSLELDYLTGGRLSFSVFDLDGDGNIGESDLYSGDTVSGKKREGPAVVGTILGENEIECLGDDCGGSGGSGVNNGAISKILGVKPPTPGRLSWREVD